MGESIFKFCLLVIMCVQTEARVFPMPPLVIQSVCPCVRLWASVSAHVRVLKSVWSAVQVKLVIVGPLQMLPWPMAVPAQEEPA